VTWREYHTASSRAAAEAEVAVRENAGERALSLYRQAAEAEEAALAQLDPAKRRTLGITAVSAVALWCKGKDYHRARQLVDRLAGQDLPPFATRQIGEILEGSLSPLDDSGSPDRSRATQRGVHRMWQALQRRYSSRNAAGRRTGT
jgi:hypothetical protein